LGLLSWSVFRLFVSSDRLSGITAREFSIVPDSAACPHQAGHTAFRPVLTHFASVHAPANNRHLGGQDDEEGQHPPHFFGLRRFLAFSHCPAPF